MAGRRLSAASGSHDDDRAVATAPEVLRNVPATGAAGTLESPAVVRERLVRFRHAVGLFALLDGTATAFRGIHQFGGELARHGVLATLAGGLDQPAHRQRHAARGTHFDR